MLLPFASVSSYGIEVAYMASSMLFVIGIKYLGKVKTAKRGNDIAALGMAVAMAATMWILIKDHSYDQRSWALLVPSLAIGSGLGWWLAKRVPMTAMPEFVAVFNGFGGLASLLVAMAEVTRATRDHLSVVHLGGVTFAIAVAASIVIGGVTFTGSMIAYAKLAGKVNKSRFGPLGSTPMNIVLALGVLALTVWGCFFAHTPTELWISNGLLALVTLTLGIGLTMPIGGADMPVAIALLNSYSGVAGMTTGFVLDNNVLIVAGSLVGASGIILTQVMCKAMNRSLSNVLLGVMGDTGSAASKEGYTKVKTTTAEELAPLLDAARLVIIVPGYGLAVAQAQHKVRELATLLEKKGCVVKYAIHPVAGRMPGHMNILLAEANVPYEQLYELDHINDEFSQADVVLVLGANDVCNPAANDDPKSPIAGMPVLSVWNARTVVVVKRSLSAGYAGIRNELFQLDNTLMLLADAKKALEDLVTELKAQ
ncbi:MAG TPA: NAD(P)(+) transhydrogenase (Re/Si-specific) subunit beta [Planctomycetota bacterium]|nr:NAD(P)(+) transhydrogenase (Re/Si-specific) subunit beta [Planctomycetota bacterium]